MQQAGYTDIHTHILPGVDDGAQTLEESLELLEEQYRTGVRQIVLTPHFYPEKETLEAFLTKRANAYETLQDAVRTQLPRLQLKVAAEVRYSTKLMEYDLRPLCIEETPYMLLEFSTHIKPFMFEQGLFYMQRQGVVPILAHTERYPYVMQDPPQIAEWIDSGMLIQINAASLLRAGAEKKNAEKLIKWNMAHLLASDTHALDRRPPNLQKGLACLGEEQQMFFVRNADRVFQGKVFAPSPYKMPRKWFTKWV